MAQSRPDIEAIFFTARNLEPRERAACLAEACSGDDALRERVERFLSAQAEIGSFLEPPGGDTADEPGGALTGSVIGPYKLLEQIGEGGFGVVFMAEQTQPVRR